ncbi:MAG: archaellin/type IV pilin N-terminal domain-containing protein [Nitrososphaerota archaeon]
MMNKTYKNNSKKGLTGLETAIILISFVIVAAAFSFAVLNLGLFTTQKNGEVLQAGLEEATSAIETVGGVIAQSSGDTVSNVTVYFKVSVGKRPIDMRVGQLVISYHDSRASIPNVYTSNATSLPLISSSSPGVMVRQITGDGDNLIEYGELWSVSIAIAELKDLSPNEVFAIELKPPTGSVLKVERRLPPALDQVMDLT